MVDCLSTVQTHRPLQAGYSELLLAAREIADRARPGQFVHVRIPGLNTGALRRPFSIAGAENGVLRILYKTVGLGTEAMAHLRPGDALSVIGPLGNGFPLDPLGAPLLVAGGYGVAPLGFLAKRLGMRGTLLVGGRAEDDILDIGLFEEMGWSVRIATQDGSRGIQGLVTLPLDAVLEEMTAACVTPEIYACGPEGLMRAVSERGRKYGCRTWLSLDKRMVCGVGACLACVQKLRREDGSEWVGRVCKDGPVFEAREIVWGAA